MVRLGLNMLLFYKISKTKRTFLKTNPTQPWFPQSTFSLVNPSHVDCISIVLWANQVFFHTFTIEKIPYKRIWSKTTRDKWEKKNRGKNNNKKEWREGKEIWEGEREKIQKRWRYKQRKEKLLISLQLVLNHEITWIILTLVRFIYWHNCIRLKIKMKGRNKIKQILNTTKLLNKLNCKHSKPLTFVTMFQASSST